MRRIALCAFGLIAIGGVAAPSLATAEQASFSLAAVSTSGDRKEATLGKPKAPKKSTRGATISRAEVIRRAKYWFDHRSDFSYQAPDHRDRDSASHKYRTDCSGFVAMALHLPTTYVNTETLPGVGTKISRKAMQPGDFTGILGKGTANERGHVRIFEKWANKGAGKYWAYDFGSTQVKHQTYMLDDDKARNGIGWTAYRYKKIH